MSSIALVDCNNFFASCERVFDPQLNGRPLVILSSNDGCIIARSNEAKALGIPMGAPHFHWADFMRAHDVVTRSSNFALYGDFSHRVMRILARFNPDLEIYSVDEAFLFVGAVSDPLTHCRQLRENILQWTGIPVSIGISSTKTLAKVATRLAKKQGGLYHPTQAELDRCLHTLFVSDIWGIGRRLTHFLAKRGIHTAAQLRDQKDTWLRKNLSVVGLRTAWELRGISCLPLDEAPSPKQSIMTSRSFGRPIISKVELSEAIATYAVRGAEKLREEKRVASQLQVFVMSKEYSNQAHLVLPEPTQFTPTLLEYARRGLNSIFRPGYAYKKGGVLLSGLAPEENYQRDLFVDPVDETKQKAAMALLDRANNTFGYRILQFAAEGTQQSWKTKRGQSSPCFTTSWHDLFTISI
ncbi:MAG: Protein UmuC [Chlamydiales bacterium]|nr:Protein UmuC [Chlamydiales bacterium]